jgi:hypothetical protein
MFIGDSTLKKIIFSRLRLLGMMIWHELNLLFVNKLKGMYLGEKYITLLKEALN